MSIHEAENLRVGAGIWRLTTACKEPSAAGRVKDIVGQGNGVQPLAEVARVWPGGS